MKQRLTGLLILSLTSFGALSVHAQPRDLDDLDGAPPKLLRWERTEAGGCTTLRQGTLFGRICRVERRGSTPSWIPPRAQLRGEIPQKLDAADVPGDDVDGTPSRPRREDAPAIILPRREGAPAIILPRREGTPALILPRRARRLLPRLRTLPAPGRPPTAAPTLPPAPRAPLSPQERPHAIPPHPRPAVTGTVVIALTPREAQVFALLNAARRHRGLAPLRVDPRAVRVARAHSRDMCTQHYFDHRSPQGLAPWDRLRAGGVSFSSAGENIAVGYTTALGVHRGWMKSPGHRANRMNPSYTRVGIGVASCGGHPRWTEVFMR